MHQTRSKHDGRKSHVKGMLWLARKGNQICFETITFYGDHRLPFIEVYQYVMSNQNSSVLAKELIVAKELAEPAYKNVKNIKNAESALE